MKGAAANTTQVIHLRHQLPAYSPLSADAISGAFVHSLFAGPTEVKNAGTLLMREFAAEGVILCDSGRSALQLAIGGAIARAGAKRIVGLPAFQCFEVGSAAVGAGCSIALYDVDPTTLGPDFDSLERLLRQGTRVLVIAPFYGLPVDWDRVTTLCEQFGAVAIEDAAQGHGAEWRGRAVGSLGSMSTFSFGRGKAWTGGGGGALCLRSEVAPPLEDFIRHLRFNGGMVRVTRTVATTAAQWLVGRPHLYGVPASIPALGLGETRYRDPTPPAAMSAFSAALLCRTAEPSRREVRVRRDNAARWFEELPKNVTKGLPHVLDGASPGYLRFPLRLPRNDAKHLSSAARRAGVYPSYPATLADLPRVFERLLEPTRDYPGAQCLARELVTLPTHSLITDEDRATIVAAI